MFLIKAHHQNFRTEVITLSIIPKLLSSYCDSPVTLDKKNTHKKNTDDDTWAMYRMSRIQCDQEDVMKS